MPLVLDNNENHAGYRIGAALWVVPYKCPFDSMRGCVYMEPGQIDSWPMAMSGN